MICQGKALLVSHKQESFTDKSGKDIHFQRVVILPDGDDDTLSLTAPVELQLDQFKQMQPVLVTLNVSKNYQGYIRAKIHDIKA